MCFKWNPPNDSHSSPINLFWVLCPNLRILPWVVKTKMWLTIQFLYKTLHFTSILIFFFTQVNRMDSSILPAVQQSVTSLANDLPKAGHVPNGREHGSLYRLCPAPPSFLILLLSQLQVAEKFQWKILTKLFGVLCLSLAVWAILEKSLLAMEEGSYHGMK